MTIRFVVVILRMTKLLVSVRSVAEAQLAAAAGVDLIDIKEPARGSLGAADAATICAIAAALPPTSPLSAALGELVDIGESAAVPRLDRWLQALPESVRYAKLGLAGTIELPDWPERWSAALAQFPAHVAAVAVAYADWRDACSPEPSEVWRLGRRLGCRALLIDTYLKRGQTLLDWLSVQRLADLQRQVHGDGAILVLAGSLTVADIANLLPLGPDYVAVRGAACAPGAGRTGSLDAARLADLTALMGAARRRRVPSTAAESSP